MHLHFGSQEEGKEQLMFLKQRSTDIAVQTEGKVVVDVDHTLGNVIYEKRKKLSNLIGLSWKIIVRERERERERESQ